MERCQVCMHHSWTYTKERTCKGLWYALRQEDCLRVKYNMQDEKQSSILQKKKKQKNQLPLEGCEIREAFQLPTLH